MKRYIFKIYFLSVLLCQTNTDNIIIKNVDVVGNEITSKNTIIFTSGLRKGQTVNPSDFPRAIKRIWKLDLFQDVQIQLDDEQKDGISITIMVVENFVLGNIKYEGNKKIKRAKLDEEIELSNGQRIKPNTITEISRLIKELYVQKGYLNATIEHELTIPKKETKLFGGKGKDLVRDIIFKIEENKKIKIANIRFDGNNNFSDFRLRWIMKETKKQRWR